MADPKYAITRKATTNIAFFEKLEFPFIDTWTGDCLSGVSDDVIMNQMGDMNFLQNDERTHGARKENL